MKQNQKSICWGLCMLVVFVVWTVLLRFVDVGSIGPNGSLVGFAVVNQWFHNLTGTHMTLYHITDWLGLVPVAVGFAFAILGLVQWVRRRSIWKVDFSILLLGVFYLTVLGIYLLFETYVVNYRPVLIAGFLEASYPSSTTVLVMCVMPTAILQLRARIRNNRLRKVLFAAINVFTAFMVVGRLLSGVHWLSDIVGGALLSAGLILLYHGIAFLNT